MRKTKLMQGDNIESLKKLPDNCIDSVVTDPPYGLSFMNKKWDYDVPSVQLWKEVYRVLKPGGHVLSFGGTRTYHRMVVNMEDAGFEIRDQIQWIYASGFPKSLNIQKQFEKNGYKICECSEQNTEHGLRPLPETNISQTINTENEQRETLLSQLSQQDIQVPEYTTDNVWGEQSSMEGWNNSIQEEGKLQGNNLQESTRASENDGEKGWLYNGAPINNGSISEATIDENGSGSSHRPQSKQQSSKQSGIMADKRRPQESGSRKICGRCGEQVVDIKGFGTALKPANEPICLARKPLSEKSVAENVLKWKTGGINVDGCRVGTQLIKTNGKGSMNGSTPIVPQSLDYEGSIHEGRFPANIILECCCDEVIKGEKGDIHTNPDCPCYIMDSQSGKLSKQSKAKRKGGFKTEYVGGDNVNKYETMAYTDEGGASRFFYQAKVSKKERNMGLDGFEEKQTRLDANYQEKVAAKYQTIKAPAKNSHPTVKPVSLMTYLCRLITPSNGIVLDPFMGSGSTGIAAQLEGFRFCGMEMDVNYFKIAEARIESYEKYRDL